MTTVNKKLDLGQFFLQNPFMNKPVQKRTLETRARLIDAAEAVIAENGFEAMRVEEVVLRAGTAKGTFFAHFRDKDALMDRIIGERLHAFINGQEAAPVPDSVDELIDTLIPICAFMTSERYVFDVILRHSGAAALDDIGTIAETFGRQVELLQRWMTQAPFRKDISAELQAEGIHAFMIQAMATNFCALHNSQSFRDRLGPYLKAWLTPV